MLIIICVAILIKFNVTATKEPKESNSKDNTTVLDVKSKLVKDIYKSLNMDLVNNTCSNYDKCLINENYLNLYYNDEKKLNDDEMLYFVLNKIYEEGKYSSMLESSQESNQESSQESNTESSGTSKIVIDKFIVSEELKNMFNKDYKDFDNKLVQSNSCGIKEYTFTGESYELVIEKCKSNKDSYSLTKVSKAFKKDNHITLIINRYSVNEKDFNEIEKYNEENKQIEKYNFDFKLYGDKYYLNRINKID